MSGGPLIRWFTDLPIERKLRVVIFKSSTSNLGGARLALASAADAA
jgi:hypothetical protein